MKELLKKATETYNLNFDGKTWFGRCIFVSWYCERATCKFCFRSTIQHKIKHSKSAKRSLASILTDAIIGNRLGWRSEFLTGGYGVFSFEELLDITKKVSEVYDQKLWINLGLLTKEQLIRLKPYVEGICASIETIEGSLHDELCPDKPIKPYEEMLDTAEEIGLKKSMTIVIGLGEKEGDFELLEKFIKKHELDRITFYALKPVKGTPFTESPDPEYYASWIAKTRIAFPKLEIIAGLTPRRPDYTRLILEAGANAVTKFPVLAKFGSEGTKIIEKGVKEAGREFTSIINGLPDIDWDKEVDKFSFDKDLKEKIKIKVKQYVDKIRD